MIPHSVRILGSIEITPAGTTTTTTAATVTALRPRRVALLSYLLLARRAVRRQELAALLWPDAEPKRARGSLNQLMVEMRRDFGAEAFDGRNPDDIRIAAGAFTCDAAQLIEMSDAGKFQSALELYTGPLLDGFRIDGLDAFNDWADAARRRIDDMVAGAATKAASLAQQPHEAVEALQLAARLRPYDEAILRARMTATAAVSGAAAATALFEAHRTRIAEELSLSPAPETRKLLFEICAASNRAVEPAAAASGKTPGDGSRTVAAVTAVTAVTQPGAVTPSWRPDRQYSRIAVAAAIAACLMLALATLMVVVRPHARTIVADASDSVNIALLSFGDQSQPSIRALPGLVATYLIRDTSIELSGDTRDPATFQVVANLKTEKDEMTGTLQILVGENVISSTAVRTSTRAGMDTIAAQLARYVSGVVRPLEHYPTPAGAVSAARQHLLFARADFARGVRQNAIFELDRATQQLDSVTRASRNDEWNAVRDAVSHEREVQGGLQREVHDEVQGRE
jgi:DNA-binding SARP family transcriptional activator